MIGLKVVHLRTAKAIVAVLGGNYNEFSLLINSFNSTMSESGGATQK